MPHALPEGMRGSVTVTNTVVERDISQVRARIDDILACRRILSTSLHALVIAEAYGIPSATFDIHAGPSGRFAADDESVPSTTGSATSSPAAASTTYWSNRNERHLPTDWDGVIAFLDRHWAPLEYARIASWKPSRRI
jgi:pyruvyltransferase